MSLQNLASFSVPPGFRGRNIIWVQLWWLVQSTLFSASPQFAYGWRRFLLRLFGAKIGKEVIIRPSVKITYPWKLSIEDYAWVGDEVILYTLGEIIIERNAVVSQKCHLCTGGHDYKKSSFDIYSERIVIGEESWLCADVFVAPGVIIGSGAVIGARSTVFHNMPKSMVCVGAPAKPMKRRLAS